MRKNKKTAGISAKQTGKKVGGMTTVKQLMPYLGRRRLSLLLTLLPAAWIMQPWGAVCCLRRHSRQARECAHSS